MPILRGSGTRGLFLETLCCFHLPFLASGSFHGGYLAQPDRCPPNKSFPFPHSGISLSGTRGQLLTSPSPGVEASGVLWSRAVPPAWAVSFLLREAAANGQMGRVSAGTSCQAGYVASLPKLRGLLTGHGLCNRSHPLPSTARAPDLKHGAGVRFIHSGRQVLATRGMMD